MQQPSTARPGPEAATPLAGASVLVTGGAGFIGSNLVERLLREGAGHVRVLDNLSRRGVEHNLQWLRGLPGAERLEIVEGDIRDPRAVRDSVRGATEIYHLAAQVAVTSSVEDPRTDFEANALGTLNVLEAARAAGNDPYVLFTSTNKVYGGLDTLPVAVEGTRYTASRPNFQGVTELEPLDFHSPYGCSKGAADQYVRDYARIYGMDTVVFRMSCIAGPRQFGNEDQGWVAHFLYSVLAGQTVTVCGDGFQVRDILHVDDLLDAMLAARARRRALRGEVFNLGGGMARTVSVIEMLRLCEQRTGLPLRLRYAPVRPGDQPLYISDTGRLEAATGWRAGRSLGDIFAAIERFYAANQALIAAAPAARELVAEEVA